MTETESSALEQSVIDALGLESAAIEPVGAQLRAARMAANLTVRQVAEELYLLPNQVEALETGNYKRFRAEIFSRGYLRAYAKFLDLDDQAIVDGYVNAQPERQGVTKSARQHIQNPTKGRSVKYWFLALAVALTFMLWWLNTDVKTADRVSPENASVIVDKNDVSLIASLDDSATAAMEQSVEQTIAQAATQSPDTAVDSAVASGLETAVVKPVALSTSTSAETQPVVAAAIIALPGSLKFSFSADCWVEVRNGDDDLIYADLRRASDTLDLQGKEPFNIVLGYAPGVSLYHNGTAVIIQADTRTNAAEFVVKRS